MAHSLAMALLGTLLLSYWGLPGPAWLLMSLALSAYAVTHGVAFVRPARSSILLFAAPIGFGFAGFASHPLGDAAKDVWYFSKPVVEIAFGLLMAAKLGVRRCLWVMIGAAAIVSLDYVVRVLLLLPEYLANSVGANRTLFGTGSFLSLLACVIALDPDLRRRLAFEAPLQVWALRVTVIVSLVALGLSRSRTLGVLLTLFVLLRAVRVVSRSGSARFASSLGLLTAGVLTLTLSWSGVAEIGSPESVLTPPEEVVVSDEYLTDTDVNTHWRGFESLMALLQYGSFGATQKVVGGGFGQKVELDKMRELAGEQFDAIPVLHNGFLYVLVKTGLAGELLFVAALASLLRALSPRRGEVTGPRVSATTAFWLVAALALTSMVISGPYNKSELLPLLILCGVYASMTAAGGQSPSTSPAPVIGA
ncbi:hypothetical protein [Anaeromyxobacter sp. SG17]|uniref:hypothetical protein n=1 Tax=Anaeromyxobacter sp. SG17 TaxID=2925405 RepID=UPI001F55E648|nr:hypothetical protein [Anaeromyxobacter sp. SG17]